MCLHTHRQVKVKWPSRETSKALRHGWHAFTCLPLPRKCSPDGATTDWWWHPSNCSLLLIYRPRKDERLSWPSWLTYLQQMVYPYKWLPVSCRSSGGQGKCAGQRSTFYHCAMQPAKYSSIVTVHSITSGTPRITNMKIITHQHFLALVKVLYALMSFKRWRPQISTSYSHTPGRNQVCCPNKISHL